MNQDFFLSSFLIAYAILLFWFFFIVLAQDFVYSLHQKWFAISKEDFLKANYFLMGFFKLLVIVVFLIPYLSMRFF